MKKLLVIMLIHVAVAIPYFLFDGEREVLDASARKNLSGGFIELSQGVTHYELAGPEDGRQVVLVHGYSVPYFLWDPTFKTLTEAGFRVLRYDMYGRGFSDRPNTDNNPDLFDRQLVELLDALGIKGPVDLAGISMGGAVSTVFAERRPERVRKLILIAPFGFPQELGFLANLIKTPLLGEYMMAVAGDKVMKGRLADNFNGVPEGYERFKAGYEEQMKYKGYKKALLSSMRHFMSLDFTPSFEAVGRHGLPVLLIWGRQDGVVPFEYNEKVGQAVGNLEFVPVDGAGHQPQWESPEAVNRAILDFLAK
jgi:pimeloyl-ACP methyl ester carboxylesterase